MKAQLAAKGKSLQYIIVDLSPVTDIDASAVHFLMVRLLTSRLASYLSPSLLSPIRAATNVLCVRVWIRVYGFRVSFEP